MKINLNSSERKRTIVILSAVLCCLLSLLIVLSTTGKTYSASVTIDVPDGENFSVYIGGIGVTRNSDGKYAVESGSEITVTVINESGIFESVNITGVSSYESGKQTQKVTVNADAVSVSVTGKSELSGGKGRYFGNPYLISSEEYVYALSRILKGEGSDEDFGRFGKTISEDARKELATSYYKMTTSLFLSAGEFTGIGSRGGLAFQGCFDFNGHKATIGINRTDYNDYQGEFVSQNFGTSTAKVADYGFFSYVYGDGENPCLVRNADVQGYIGINTENQSGTDSLMINAGGLAGTAGKNVIFDGISSKVSVSVQVNRASLYIGGVFGRCSSSVEAWCKAEYDSRHHNVSGITSGTGAVASAGGFAGFLHNASVSGFVMSGGSTTVLASSLGENSGSAYAGGFAGVVYLGRMGFAEESEPSAMLIADVTMKISGEYLVSAVINNSGGDKSSIDIQGNRQVSAISGGVAATIHRGSQGLSEDRTVTFTDVRYEKNGGNGDVKAKITAQTADESASGVVIAGGGIGFANKDVNKYIEYASASLESYVFHCEAEISATQNGYGPAYAGGIFGVGSFEIRNLIGGTYVPITAGCAYPEYSYTVTAQQSASSRKYKANNTDVRYEVCAGGYSSRLKPAIVFGGVTFNLGKGTIRAIREVASTAIGDIAAGGFAGIITADDTSLDKNTSVMAGSISNLTVKFSRFSSVEASCYSFDSNDGDRSGSGKQSRFGNNVYSGGVLGAVIRYDYLSGIKAEYDSSVSGNNPSGFFVRSVNNAFTGNEDLKGEGYTGGAFGFVLDTRLKDIEITGNEAARSLVYFESSHSPNTASVGGLIGAIWAKRRTVSGTDAMIDGAEISHIQVVGQAYSGTQSGDTYDLFVGGAIGVFGSQDGGRNNTMRNVAVRQCSVDAIGENVMLTYAGGLCGGVWWNSSMTVTNCSVYDSSITASSVSSKAYAAGAIGLAQRCTISSTKVLRTDVRAISTNNQARVAGITSRTRALATVTGNYSNATLHAKGGSSSDKGGIVSDNSGLSASNNWFVTENAGTPYAYGNITTGGLHLISYGNNEGSLNVNGTLTAYPLATNRNYITIKSNNTGIATVNGNTVRGVSDGVAYIGAYGKINGEEFLLCSYPVKVGNPSAEPDFSLEVTGKDDNGQAKAFDAKVDIAGTKYIYVRHEIGSGNASRIIITPKIGESQVTAFSSIVNLYKVENLNNLDNLDDNARASAILNAKGTNWTSAQLSTFAGNLVIEGGGAEDTESKVWAYETISERIIVVGEHTNGSEIYGVIIEFVPNEVTGVVIAPEEGTPPLHEYEENGNKYYVYAPGDKVRFAETVLYRHPNMVSYVVKASFSGASVVTSNGTVNIPSNAQQGQIYQVTCTVIGRTDISTTVYIVIQNELDFRFVLDGADVTSERKLVSDSSFNFTISPKSGYGLEPTVKFRLGTTEYTGIFNEDFSVLSVGTYDFVVQSHGNRKYTVTVSKEFVNNVPTDTTVEIVVGYKLIYNIVFRSNFGAGNDESYDIEPFIITVPAGTPFTEIGAGIEGDLYTYNGKTFKEWESEVTSKRFGYKLYGFYQVDYAGINESYGDSLDELVRSTVRVNGAMRFHARWVYGVVIEAPDGVTMRSVLADNELLEGSVQNIDEHMIPADAKRGFGFVAETPSSWIGKVRFDAYLVFRDGSKVPITDKFVPSALNNSWIISPEKLTEASVREKDGTNEHTGLIYIVVYADSLEKYAGDEVRYDADKIYSDAAFTLVYNVNYGSGDSALASGAIAFDKALPEGTSFRLYYHRNGVPTFAGGFTASAATNSVGLDAFLSFGGGALSENIRKNGATMPGNEKFIIVVTLPFNKNNFGEINEQSSIDLGISADCYDFEARVFEYGLDDQSKGVIGYTENDGVARLAEDKRSREEMKTAFDVYASRLYKHGNSGSTITFYGSSALIEGVTDYRKQGLTFVVKVTRKDGTAMVSDNVFPATQITAPYLKTTTALYYYTPDIGTGGSMSWTYDGNIYDVCVIAVKNPYQPSEGIVVGPTP